MLMIERMLIGRQPERVVDVEQQRVAVPQERQIGSIRQARVEAGRVEAAQVDHLRFDIEGVLGGNAQDAVLFLIFAAWASTSAAPRGVFWYFFST